MIVHSNAPLEDSKESRIMDAALQLFAERGYHGTSVPEIARVAAVGAGTIYRYFDSKDLLVNLVYRREKRALMSQLLEGLQLDRPVRELFHELWARLAGFARQSPISFAFLELHHHGEYLDSTSRQLEIESLLPIATFLETTRAAAVTRPIPTPALMAIIWGAIVGMVKAQRLGYLQLTDQLIAETECACWAALSADGNDKERK